jgi:hypothetical protein
LNTAAQALQAAIDAATSIEERRSAAAARTDHQAAAATELESARQGAQEAHAERLALVTALDSEIASLELESDACDQALEAAEQTHQAAEEAARAAEATRRATEQARQVPEEAANTPAEPSRPDAAHGHEISIQLEQPAPQTHVVEARDVSLAEDNTTDRVHDSRWLSSVGVTGNPDRDAELGSGKWTEPARSREELAAAMGGLGGPRELDLGEAGLPWGRILMAATVLLVAGGYWLSSYEKAPVESTRADTTAAQKQPHVAIESSRAAGSDLPTVTITTNVTAARVYLDDEYHGPAPATLSIPVDQALHKLCIRTGDFEHCDQLTSEQLAMNPVFDLPIVD